MQKELREFEPAKANLEVALGIQRQALGVEHPGAHDANRHDRPPGHHACNRRTPPTLGSTGTTASPAYWMNGVGTIGVVCHSVICVIDVRCAVLLCWGCTDTLNTAKHLQQLMKRMQPKTVRVG